ncbi:hypothetical protein EZS27_021896 [termite gut metagenome]|uniref:Uncharacterized protein n=1 Tax=termite gut metagenome TaxID=433724 RepID=A0A5J4R6L4_9ZZZZ
MELTKEQVEKIESAFKFIYTNYKEFEENSEDISFEKNEDGEYDLIHFQFPGEQEYLTMEVTEFLEIVDEIPSLRIHENYIIRTEHLGYYIVEAADQNYNYAIRNFDGYNFSSNKENIEISLVFDNFFIGLAATTLKAYEDDYWGAISPYMGIEVKYLDGNTLSQDDELKLVRSFLFEIADSTGIALTFSPIRNTSYDYEELPDESGEYRFSKLREIEPYNEGMKLFVSALQIQEPELRFLNFYKILEHFAPVVVNIEAHELMRKKLDAPKKQFGDGDFIRSIFDLAKSMRAKFNDEDLIKSTFACCFDFVGLFELLPNGVQTKVKKQINKQTIDYSTEKQALTTAANMVGKIIYATRNRVVHAKSNYETTGNECDSADLDTLNGFIKEACSQSIRWYNRQPQHLKLSVIQ